jgi:catechol 2,3-dioxygenase-like lactoylglutathione lyase family enzyme
MAIFVQRVAKTNGHPLAIARLGHRARRVAVQASTLLEAGIDCGLDHLVLTVADIGRTCDFYTRAGMDVTTFGEGRTALRFGQQKINLHPADNIPGLVADKPTPGSGDLCFITETPLAEVVAHLQRCGVPIIAGPGPRAGAIGTIQSVYIRDPDQNLVEISNY